MKIKVHPVSQDIEIDIPDYVFKAYDEKHFMFMLNSYIRERMMQPDWYHVNANDVEEMRIAYKRRKKGEDRIEGEMERGNIPTV